MEVIELLLHEGLVHAWVRELHLDDLLHDVAVLFTSEEHLDLGHGHLLLRALLGIDDHADAALVELNDGLHHAESLPEGAVVIVVRERVLLEELVLDDISSLKENEQTRQGLE